MRRRRTDSNVFVVTDAGRSPAQDRDLRTRRYLVKMGIRTAALILAIVLWSLGVPWPYLLALIVLSTVIPFFSVVSANAPSADPGGRPDTYFRPDSPRALGPPPSDRER